MSNACVPCVRCVPCVQCMCLFCFLIVFSELCLSGGLLPCVCCISSACVFPKFVPYV